MIRRQSKSNSRVSAGSLDELLSTEPGILAAALAIGARRVAGSIKAERARSSQNEIPRRLVRELIEQIREGYDPLGNALCCVRSPAERRPKGAVYTPPEIVKAMGDWAEGAGTPDRVVDPGTGSGRFLLDAAQRFKRAELIGFDVDPLAAAIAGANLAAIGAADRSLVVVSDYCRARLKKIEGTTLFIGNPPYIRHHELPTASKEWLTANAAKSGFKASQLAGLHVHFFLATVLKGQFGDYGAFITAAEWLDVNYGSIVRDMLLSTLGGRSIIVIDPTAEPFPGIAATGAIATFRLRSQPKELRLRRVGSLSKLGKLAGGKPISREHLKAETRWSRLTGARGEAPAGFVELGELCRVHRGQVTGANKIWIEGAHSRDLPESVLFRSVTRARELIRAGVELADDRNLRRVIDLPVDLDRFDEVERRIIDAFLRQARKAGAHEGYIARTRKAWWSVGLRAPAAILATYMARRPPAFVLNVAGARHINVAHGVYPRERLDHKILRSLVAYLSACITQGDGRTYAGGLTKFEPREMERIMIPPPSMLEDVIAAGTAKMV